MILITGASGKTGSAITNNLISKGEPLRVLVHDRRYLQEFKTMGAIDVVVGDMLDQEFVNEAYSGIRAVYHIAPAANSNETLMGQIAINAASSSKIEHFVYHSVLHPQLQALPHHKMKNKVEDLLIDSGVPYTIIQPAVYMQNILDSWKSIIENGIYTVPYGEKVKISYVDLLDVAEVVSLILTQQGHLGATYELCGHKDVSAIDIANILSRSLGHEITVKSITTEMWAVGAAKFGIKQHQLDILLKMFEHYNKCGFTGNSNVLTWLLGKKPNDFSTFIHRTIQGEK
jgi:uncharacterized protein YbjT (DUF2867 family)